MASKSFITLAIVAIVVPTVAMATDYIVGDKSGWTTKVDYQAWAKDKVFYVGDRLVFQYKPDNHNVFKVNGTQFTECIIPPPSDALTTGNDTVTLASTGKKWYICGKPKHCAEFGMKLVITVQAEAPTPAPTQIPVPTPTPGSSAGFQIRTSSASQVITATMVFIAMIVV